jgi:hypothetical protein
MSDPMGKNVSVGAPQIFKGAFDFQLVRAMGTQTYGGAEIGECLSTARKIVNNDTESWFREWDAIGSRINMLGDGYLANGDKVSAREAFQRANCYYRSAEFFLERNDPRHRETWQNARSSFQKAAVLFDVPIEIIEIPYQDISLPAYFVPGSSTGDKCPTLLLMGGFDSSVEELYYFGGAAGARRGYNVLQFEGPGQRTTAHMHPGSLYQPDYEIPVSTVVDYAITRSDVDADKLAFAGFSLGGNLGARVGLYEKRISACIVNSLLTDLREAFLGLLGLELTNDFVSQDDIDKITNETTSPVLAWIGREAEWRFGTKNLPEFFELLRDYDLSSTIENISIPFLSIASIGEGPHIVDYTRHIQNIGKTNMTGIILDGEVDGADAHCHINNLSRMHAEMYGWLDKVLQEQR